MPLSKEERKLLHQKSQQPTFGTGKPDGLQGHDGDISYRDVEGSGTVSYLKKGNEWLAIAASGEMPPVRIIGNNSRSGVTSDHFHGMYINKNGSVTYTGDQSFGEHNITDVGDLTVLGNASVGGTFTVTGNNSYLTNALFEITGADVDEGFNIEGDGWVHINSSSLYFWPDAGSEGGLTGDVPTFENTSYRQDTATSIYQWSWRDHEILSDYEFRLHATADFYDTPFWHENINSPNYNMHIKSGSQTANGRIKIESCVSNLFDYDENSYPGLLIKSHSPSLEVRDHMNKILITQDGVRTPPLWLGDKGAIEAPGYYDFEGILIKGDGGVRISAPLTSWDDASNIVVSPCIRIQSSKHVEISANIHEGNMPTIELQLDTPDRTKIWSVFEFSSLYKPHSSGQIYTDSGKLNGPVDGGYPEENFVEDNDLALFPPNRPEWSGFGDQNHEYPKIEGLHIKRLGKASTHHTRHPVATATFFTDATCDYNNDPTITHDDDGGRITAGLPVTGTGIPTDAFVESVTSNTEFELSANTTGGSVTNGTLTFGSMSEITNARFNVLGDVYGETSTIEGGGNGASIRTIDMAPGTVWEVRVLITYIHSDTTAFHPNVSYEYGLQIGYVFFANARDNGTVVMWDDETPEATDGILDPEDTGVGYQLNYYSGYVANDSVDMGEIIFEVGSGVSGALSTEDDGIRWKCTIDNHHPASVPTGSASDYVHKKLLVYTSALRLMSGVDFDPENNPVTY